MKKTASILLAVLMLTAILTGCGSSRNTPEGVVAKFVQSINNADIKGLISCMTPDFQEAMNAVMELYGDEFDPNYLFQMMGFEGGERIGLEIKGVKTQGDRAVVTAYMSFNGSGTTSEVPCIRIDGQWYIDIDG